MNYLSFFNDFLNGNNLRGGLLLIIVFFMFGISQLKAVICYTSVIDSTVSVSASRQATPVDPNVLLRAGKWMRSHITTGMDYAKDRIYGTDTESRRDRIARKLLIMGLIISGVSGLMYLLSLGMSGGFFASFMSLVFNVVGSILSLAGLGLSIGGFAAAENKEKLIGLAIAALVVSIIMAGYGILYIILAQR